MAAIGKFVTERTQARQDLGLLGQQIKDAGKYLSDAGSILMRNNTEQAYLASAMLKINDLISAGGLEVLRQKIVDYQVLDSRIDEISRSLRNCGAE